MSGGEPRWISKDALLVLHDRSIALHGGILGLRDEGLLDSALMRPQNRYHYEGVDEPAALAASYAAAVSANHPFADGNKRAALLALGLFLRWNDLRLNVGQAEAALTILALAAGQLDVEDLTAWVRAHMAAG